MRWRRMDPEKTAPFELGHGDHACLLVHGFTGSPWDLRPLGEGLADRGYRVKAIRLPGHGTTPEAMAGVSHRDWEQATEEGLRALEAFRGIFVVGLSMGALLTLRLAARFPDQVGAIALLAPAVQFRSRRMRVVRALRRWPLLPVLRPHIEKTGTDIADPRELAQAPILPRVPSARLHDLWAVQDEAARVVRSVRAPALVAVARQDHVVDPEGGRVLARGLSGAREVRLVEIDRGYHIMTRDYGRDLVLHEVGTFFDRVRQGARGASGESLGRGSQRS